MLVGLSVEVGGRECAVGLGDVLLLLLFEQRLVLGLQLWIFVLLSDSIEGVSAGKGPFFGGYFGGVYGGVHAADDVVGRRWVWGDVTRVVDLLL